MFSLRDSAREKLKNGHKAVSRKGCIHVMEGTVEPLVKNKGQADKLFVSQMLYIIIFNL